MELRQERGGIVLWILILIAAVGMSAAIYLPGLALSRTETEVSTCRAQLLDIVTFENRCFTETKAYVGTLDSLQTFLGDQTERYDMVVDSLTSFFDLTDQPLESVEDAANLAGNLREYLQYVGDLEIKGHYVAIADSVFQFLKYQGEIQRNAGDFRRLFDEISQALEQHVIDANSFSALASQIDSLELAFRADSLQLAQHQEFREVLYLTRALLPARDAYTGALGRLGEYLESGPRGVEDLRQSAAVADSVRFAFLFGGDGESAETLESIANLLKYRGDLVERRSGYESLFDEVALYLRDPARDPEEARERSDHVDSLKYCFLFTDPQPMEEGQEKVIDRTTHLGQISNYLYGLASSWNAQVDSLSEVVPESQRRAHRVARAELMERFAQAQAGAIKTEKSEGYAVVLGEMKVALGALLDGLDAELRGKTEALPPVQEALNARLAGSTTQNVDLTKLRETFESNLLGQEVRYAQLKGQLTGENGLNRSKFPPDSLVAYCPAYPRARYRLEIDGDKVSARCFHGEDHGQILQGDPNW